MRVHASVERAIRYLEASLDAVEQRFSALLAQGLLADPHGLRIRGDLRRIFLDLVEVEGRRDMTFSHVRRLEELRRRGIWLYRRLVQEHVFARKTALEEKLKSLMSPEAYDVYLSLQECELEEDADQATSDEDLVLRLLE